MILRVCSLSRKDENGFAIEVSSKKTEMLVEWVVRKTVIMRSKMAFQMSTSGACLLQPAAALLLPVRLTNTVRCGSV